jgi:hypothetical protein
MHLAPHELAALIAVISFAAGLNVYATVASLGLLARFGGMELPPELHDLTNWAVIVIAVVMFAIEFVADKIPGFELVWNGLHTFVRIPVAAFLAYQASSGLPAWEQALAVTAGSLIAFAAHGGKMAARMAVAPSPVPFTGATVSFGEDAFVIFLMWLITVHPFLAAAIVLVLVVSIVLFVRWMFCMLRNIWRRLCRKTPAPAPA